MAGKRLDFLSDTQVSDIDDLIDALEKICTRRHGQSVRVYIKGLDLKESFTTESMLALSVNVEAWADCRKHD